MYLVAFAVVAVVLLIERALSVRPARPRDTRLRSAPVPRTEATGKTYLVIGGHGLLGSHVVEALLARGERKVRVLDVAPCGLFAAETADGTVETVIGSVADPATVARAVEGVDCVFLTAAIVDYWSTYDWEWPRIEAVNVRGTENVVAACVAAGVRKLLFTSSSSVCVPHDLLSNPVADEDESCPTASAPFLCHYIKSKVLSEEVVLAANSPGKASLKTAAFRPGGIYGPRDQLVASTAQKGEPGIGNADAIIDFTYVENVVHAMLLGEGELEPRGKACGEAFFVTDRLPGEDVTPYVYEAWMTEQYKAYGTVFALVEPEWIMEKLAAVVDWLIWVTRGGVTPYLGQLAKLRPPVIALSRGTYYYSHAKAKKLLKYRPPFTAAAALARSVEHYRREQAAI